ncbi:hypothetical protein HJC23_003638 [Cyclotella cryptica]|uniref:Uncharacterized protein n=1 Tax=Cyclotella cryptica TaxID=29204 RepID=A0ABD3QJK1_9STRA|eukprot:CCRYP_004924-RA/>CCRYP_004924-RA protein AED:0.37 eAED:1.00 QI:0/0/0/1/1/1/2/0/1107
MWTSPDRSSSRPPTGLRNNSRSLHGRSSSSVASFGRASYTERSPSRYAGGSSASVDTISFHSAFADAEDDSSCDDTYVSITSNKSNRKNTKESLFEQSPRILKETTRVTNSHHAGRSPSLDKKKNDYSNRHTISRAESSGILDKLKSDINSLDILRKSSYSEGTVFSGSVFDFDEENKPKAAESLPRSVERSRSVDRSFRQHRNEWRGSLVVDTVLHGKYGSSAASLDGSRRINLERNHNDLRDKMQREKMEIQAKFTNKGHDLEIKLKQKDEEISRLKRECVMEQEQNDRHSTTISDLQSKLEEYMSKEAATQNALREVMKNVEHERDVRDNEMQLASKVQQAEILMLEEKLHEAYENIEELKKEDNARHNALRSEISEKTCIIDGLKRDINHLRSLLDNSTRSKADSERTLRNKIERLEMRLDEQAENEKKRVAELTEMQESSEEEWMEKMHHLESRLEEQNTREAEWNEELSEVKRELDEVKSENRDLKKVAESVESLKKFERENDELKQLIESTKEATDKAAEDLRKELAESNRQLESMKEMELERDEYVSKIEKSLENEDNEKREHTAKMEQLQQDLADAKFEQDKLKTALEKEKEATTDANAQLQDAVSKLDRIINDKRELTKRINELETENLKLASEMSSMETKMEHEKKNHNTIIAEKEKVVKDMEQTTEELNGEISEMRNEIKSYKDQLTKVPELEANIKDMKSTLDLSEDKYVSLQSKLRSVNMKFEESEKSYEELERKYKALKREQSELQERGESYASGAKTRENELLERIQKLKAEKNDAAAEIEELKEEAVKSKKELAQAKDEARSRNDQLRTALESLDEMMKYIDSMKEESDDMIKALESETEGLMKRIGILEKHRQSDQQTIQQYDEEKDKLVKKLKAEFQEKINAELQRLTSTHAKEMGQMKVKYEGQIKELESTMLQRSETTRALQEHGNSEVGSLIKKLGEVTDKHSKETRALREKYESEIKLLEASNRQLKESFEKETKGGLHATLRDLEAKNTQLEEALTLATREAENSLRNNCSNCDSIQQKLDDMKTKLQDQVKFEMKLRGELAQNKQLITITQANEKLLEEHVASLEAQINALVNDYETKLGEV